MLVGQFCSIFELQPHKISPTNDPKNALNTPDLQGVKFITTYKDKLNEEVGMKNVLTVIHQKQLDCYKYETKKTPTNSFS